MHRLRVEVQRSAECDLLRLSPTLRERVGERLAALADDSRPHGSLKLSGRPDAYRIRVGDYRVLYEIDRAAGVIFVTRVRHRSDVYRRLR